MPCPQPANQKHHLFAFQTWAVFTDDRLHLRHILGDDLLTFFLNRLVKAGSNRSEALHRLGRAEEVIFHPGNSVFLLHRCAHIIHGTMTMDQVELGFMGNSQLIDRTVTRPLRYDPQPHFLQQNARGPSITADIVVPDNGDIIRPALL
ncbi:hypothetical protein D3C74_252620 [compost metagenome]